MKMKMRKDNKDKTQIDLGPDMVTNIVNIEVSQYVLSNSLPALEAIFMRKLKVVSATLLLVYFLSIKESTCQTGKNFISKALFVLEKIKF